jgi:hypothetical protein
LKENNRSLITDEKRSTTMRNLKPLVGLVAVVCLVFLAAAGAYAQTADNARPVQVPAGTKQKVQGVVSTRNGDEFKVRAVDGAETTVLLTSNTDVTSHGLLKKDYPVTYIMRGLRWAARNEAQADRDLVTLPVHFDSTAHTDSAITLGEKLKDALYTSLSPRRAKDAN